MKISVPIGRVKRRLRARLQSVHFLAALLFFALGPVALAQQGPKLGFVSTDRVIRESAPAKAAQKRLEGEFSRREKELKDMASQIKSLGERLERDASVMNATERRRRQREYSDLEKDFQRKQREFREDLNQRRNEELSIVVERANRVIRQISEQEKYDLVLQEAVYASPRIDITDKVLRALAADK